jgi:hypothetical protein
MVPVRAEVAAALLLLVAAAGVAAGFRPEPPVSEDTLEKVAASLDMYVDVLPQMPRVLGYSLKYGRPAPAHLNIGMYQKKWVRFISSIKHAFVSPISDVMLQKSKLIFVFVYA